MKVLIVVIIVTISFLVGYVVGYLNTKYSYLRKAKRMKKVFYICDGNVSKCKKAGCYKHIKDGDCKHTSDTNHAANFEKLSKVGAFFEKER